MSTVYQLRARAINRIKAISGAGSEGDDACIEVILSERVYTAVPGEPEVAVFVAECERRGLDNLREIHAVSRELVDNR